MLWRIMVPALLIVISALTFAPFAQAQLTDCKEKDKEIVAINFAQEMQDGRYKSVSTEDLKKWVDAGRDMLIVDTMPFEASYKKQHVPAAVQFEFPIPKVTSMDEQRKADFLKLLGPDKGRLIVFYCGYTECTRSHNAGLWAVDLGYTNVYRCPGGISAWAQAGYPIETVK